MFKPGSNHPAFGSRTARTLSFTNNGHGPAALDSPQSSSRLHTKQSSGSLNLHRTQSRASLKVAGEEHSSGMSIHASSSVIQNTADATNEEILDSRPPASDPEQPDSPTHSPPLPPYHGTSGFETATSVPTSSDNAHKGKKRDEPDQERPRDSTQNLQDFESPNRANIATTNVEWGGIAVPGWPSTATSNALELDVLPGPAETRLFNIHGPTLIVASEQNAKDMPLQLPKSLWQQGPSGLLTSERSYSLERLVPLPPSASNDSQQTPPASIRDLSVSHKSVREVSDDSSISSDSEPDATIPVRPEQNSQQGIIARLREAAKISEPAAHSGLHHTLYLNIKATVDLVEIWEDSKDWWRHWQLLIAQHIGLLFLNVLLLGVSPRLQYWTHLVHTFLCFGRRLYNPPDYASLSIQMIDDLVYFTALITCCYIWATPENAVAFAGTYALSHGTMFVTCFLPRRKLSTRNAEEEISRVSLSFSSMLITATIRHYDGDTSSFPALTELPRLHFYRAHMLNTIILSTWAIPFIFVEIYHLTKHTAIFHQRKYPVSSLIFKNGSDGGSIYTELSSPHTRFTPTTTNSNSSRNNVVTGYGPVIKPLSVERNGLKLSLIHLGLLMIGEVIAIYECYENALYQTLFTAVMFCFFVRRFGIACLQGLQLERFEEKSKVLCHSVLTAYTQAENLIEGAQEQERMHSSLI